jgi:hypothetical protein
VYHRDEQQGNLVDKHQAHLAAKWSKTSDFILNISEQLTPIKNNLLSVTSTLPESNTRFEHNYNFYLD